MLSYLNLSVGLTDTEEIRLLPGGSGVQIPAEETEFFLFHNVRTSSGFYLASSSLGITTLPPELNR